MRLVFPDIMNYDDDSHESRDAVLVEAHGHDVGVGLVQREHHVDRRLAVVRRCRGCDGGEEPGEDTYMTSALSHKNRQAD